MPECDQNLITNTSCMCETNFANKKASQFAKAHSNNRKGLNLEEWFWQEKRKTIAKQKLTGD